MQSGDEPTPPEQRSADPLVPPARQRKLAKVPFVELAEGRLQGVVSSGSDASRVYVSSIGAVNHGLGCSTNNNRPCGGLRGPYACKHLDALLTEAELQYGRDRVIRYLGLQVADDKPLREGLTGEKDAVPAATIFSSFLRHLGYLEQPLSTAPIPEFDWFPALAVR